MASDPTNVSHAGEAVILVDIEDVFDGESGAEEVPASGVYDTLGLSGGSGRLYPHLGGNFG